MPEADMSAGLLYVLIVVAFGAVVGGAAELALWRERRPAPPAPAPEPVADRHARIDSGITLTINARTQRA